MNSSDPFAKPLVDVGTLSRKEDVAVLREAIRSARRLYSAPAFKDSVFETILPAANVTSDDELDAYIRSVAEPFLHGVGSAGMSPRGASWGVVDPDFTVKGVRGLRVVDASVIVSPPHRYRFLLFPHKVIAGYTQRTYAGVRVWICRACKYVDCTKVEIVP